MKKTLALISAFSFLLVSPGTARAEFFVGPGGTGSDFLTIPLSGRAAALGGSFTAGSAEVGAMEYNPAGLDGLPGTHAELSLLNYAQDASLQAVSLGIPISLPKKRGPFDRYTLAIQYRAFRADDDARNALGAKTGEFSVRDESIQVALAAPIGSKTSAGVTGKFLRREIETQSSSNFALDGGLGFSPNQRMSLGASFLNLGGGDEFIAEEDPLPLTFRGGARLHFDKMDYFLDGAIGRAQAFQPSGGFEWRAHPWVALRTGLLYHETVEFTAGLGIQMSPQGSQTGARRPYGRAQGWDELAPGEVSFRLDYAARTINELGLGHVVTFGIIF